MSGSWNPLVTPSYIVMTPGGAGGMTQGAFTIAVLFRIASGNNNGGLASMYVSTTQVRAFLVDALKLYGEGDFSDGFGALSVDTWYVGIISKPSGAAHYRFSIWPYASDGTGTMTTDESVNSGNHSDNASAANTIRIGYANTGNGLIALLGFYDYVISDSNRQLFKTNLASVWANPGGGGAPKALVSLENWDGSTGCTDLVGTSSQSSITGTVSAGANPPSFNFSVGGAPPVQAGAMAMFL